MFRPVSHPLSSFTNPSFLHPPCSRAGRWIVIMGKTADEGRDEPCCAPVAHLLLSGPHLLLLCRTAQSLAQDSTGCTSRAGKQKQDSVTGRGKESENTNERKSHRSLTEILKLSRSNCSDGSCCLGNCNRNLLPSSIMYPNYRGDRGW